MPKKQRLGIMDTALRLLSRQSFNQMNLRERLNKNGFDSEEIDNCLTRLVQWGYLNDRDYTQKKIETLIGKLKSRYYVRNYLLNEGLEANLIDPILEEIYPESLELQIAQQVLIKKQKNNFNKKNKVDYQVLVRAGFAENTIFKCFPNTDTT